MGAVGCRSKFCLSSTKRHCGEFEEEDRQAIFKNFWDFPSWSARQSFVSLLTCVGEKKIIKNHAMGNPIEYYLKKKDGKKLQDRARAEKDEDKKSALSLHDESMSVWTFDTQSVILCPQTKASALYFRTKLQVHNLTFYNNCTRDSFCYYWDESEGELKAGNFASLQYYHFKTFLASNPHIKTLVLWSDGCLYQNKNACLANCYSQLALESKVDLFQKYLAVGHTQMECDSMHSVIERNMVCDIHTPNDLRIVMETARRNPSPYFVKQIKHTDFKTMSTSRFNSIRPGRKAGDSVVTQLSHIHYTSTGQILYKVFHENEDWRNLPVRIANIAKEDVEWKPMYSSRLKIT
ncbi:hypothetical protein PoB_002606400 [Plakobranchus ocellatus]|uniref:DUF7869 domain-containing protein n=1 Tax=Plakobranchus ocellatus TaxID=259542 RepID=A0AAV3ZYW6_9GAST|nr:hypothetical protein PoB_002606400 [Plakobranchus ocellatus]